MIDLETRILQLRHKQACISMQLALKRIALAYGFKYAPDQPRDDHGRWTSGGGVGAADVSGQAPVAAPPPKLQAKPIQLALNDTGSMSDAGILPVQTRADLRQIDRQSPYTSSLITSKDEAEKLAAGENDYFGRNSECASLTHYFAPQLPQASVWRRGDLVQGNMDIPPGTPIATFNFYGQAGTNGYGPPAKLGGVSGESHTGIYLGQDENGVSILHQFSGEYGAPEVITIPWDKWGNNSKEAGSRYYTIDYAGRRK